MAINKEILLRNICLGLYFFFLGVEYAVIIPTINANLISLGANNTFLGIVLASFSFAGLVTAPLYGYITDKTRSIKACIMMGNLLEIGGNFMYFVGRSKYFVLGGRIIAGLGSGSVSSVFGSVSRSTSMQERTSTFAIMLMLRQVGLIIGPGFNVFLLKFNFHIGPFEANEFTSPGLFMTILWTLHTILFVFAYKEAPENPDAVRHIQGPEVMQYESVESDVGIRLNGHGEVRFCMNLVQEFTREEIVVLLATGFISTLVQTGFEAAITPMTLMYFNWQGLENSVMLLVAGGLLVLGFLLVHFASKRFSDEMLLLGGCIGLSLGYAMFFVQGLVLYRDASDSESSPWLLPALCVEITIWLFSMSFLFVSLVSLFSKLSRPEMQGFSHGIRIVAMRIGMIMGPLWAAPLVTPSRLPIMAGVYFFLVCMLTAMVIASRKRLAPPTPTICPVRDDLSENSPLVNS